MPLVSVIIPTRNRFGLLQRALKSVLEQQYRDVEILVVDDGSSDQTAGWEGDARVRVLRHQHPAGAAAARNWGLRQAQGEFIAFLDDDDTWLPNYLQQQVKSLAEADISYCRHWLNDRLVDDLLLFSDTPPVVSYLSESFLHSMSLVVCRASLFETVGLLNEEWRIAHDYDWYARAIFVGATVTRVPEPLVRRYQHGGSLVADHREWRSEELLILDRLAERFPQLHHYRSRVQAHRNLFFARLGQQRSDYRFAFECLLVALKHSWSWTVAIGARRLTRNLMRRPS